MGLVIDIGEAGSQRRQRSPDYARFHASSRAFAFFLRFVRTKFGAARLEVDAVVAKRVGGWGAGLLLAGGLIGSAYADCGSDMQKLAQARNAQLEIVNNFAKSFHGKPLDPEAFCGKSGGLVRAETALIAYMEKNKDWCSFPDEAISQLKEHHAKNTAFSAKACTVAAQMKKMKEQAAQGGGAGPQAQPLPAGPL
jgi:hypothetical protein